jgi:hypothetical protein
VIVIFVLGALVAILAWVTVFAITDAWRQAARVCESILAGMSDSDDETPEENPGRDVVRASAEPEVWTALDDYQLARFVSDASNR